MAALLCRSAREGSVAIEVSDDGPGLLRQARKICSARFLAGPPRGSGLGLAIARELTQAHGGDLALVSSTGAGRFSA